MQDDESRLQACVRRPFSFTVFSRLVTVAPLCLASLAFVYLDVTCLAIALLSARQASGLWRVAVPRALSASRRTEAKIRQEGGALSFILESTVWVEPTTTRGWPLFPGYIYTTPSTRIEPMQVRTACMHVTRPAWASISKDLYSRARTTTIASFEIEHVHACMHFVFQTKVWNIHMSNIYAMTTLLSEYVLSSHRASPGNKYTQLTFPKVV